MTRRFRSPTGAAGFGGGFGAAAPAAPAPPQPFSVARPPAGAAAPTAGAAQAGSQQRPARPAALTLADFTVRDLWDHKDLTLKETSVYIDLLPHTVKVYRFIKKI